jgi:hypothetical protein
MREFVDANRQDDVARSAVLAEELRQTERADKVLAEQTAKMQALSEEYRQKREGLLEEIETLKRENAQRIASMKEDNEHNMARAAAEKKAMEQKYDELLARYQSLDATKEKEFSARFEEMRDLNDALEDRCDHLMEVHRRSNLVSTFLIIAIAIAAVAIGFIGGEYINTQRRTALEQQQILNGYQNDNADATGSESQTQPVAGTNEKKTDDASQDDNADAKSDAKDDAQTEDNGEAEQTEAASEAAENPDASSTQGE